MLDTTTTYVVLVNWNQFDYTCACIRSLHEVNHPGVHVVVVDNGSTDQSQTQLLAEFGERIELICNEVNLGFTGGNNAGIRYALAQGADYIMLLNNDTIVAPDFLSPLLQRLEADPQIGAITAKIFYMHDPTLLWAVGGEVNMWLGRAQNRGCGERDHGQYDSPERVDYTTGCCLLARREIFERIGLLDERYFIYFEDADWCLRVQEAGLINWYEPASHIWHWAGAASKRPAGSKQAGRTNPRVYYLTTRNNLWFLREHASIVLLPISLVVFFVRYMLVYSMAFIALRRWEKLRSLWRGWVHGLAGDGRQERS